MCADVDADYGTVSFWLWTNSGYVDIGACLNLNVSLLGIRCTMTPIQFNARVLCKYGTMRNIIVWYTMHHDTIAIAPSTAIHLHYNDTMTWSQSHTRLLFIYTIMAMAHGSALMLILIEYMERCHVGFGQTGSTSVLVHA